MTGSGWKENEFVLPESETERDWRDPFPWGIWVKNMIGAASGFVALLFYLRKRLYTFGTLLLAFLCLAEVVVIILSMTGSAGRRTNGIFDITMLAMILLAYTISQTDRDLKHGTVSVSTKMSFS